MLGEENIFAECLSVPPRRGAVFHVNTTPRRTNLLVIGLALCAGFAASQPAAAQNQFYPVNATINSFVNGNAYVGYANQSDYQNGINGTSPTVALVAGGSVSGSIYTFNGSVLNVAGPTSGSDLYSEDTSTLNFSSGTVAQLGAYGSSTVNITGGTVTFFVQGADSAILNVSGGQLNGAGLTAKNTSRANVTGGTLAGIIAQNTSTVVISGGVFTPLVDIQNLEFLDESKGSFTFVGTGLTATPLGTDAQIGGTDYALGGVLQNGQFLAGDEINVQPGATMFTFGSPSTLPEPGTAWLAGVGLAALLIWRKVRARQADTSSRNDRQRNFLQKVCPLGRATGLLLVEIHHPLLRSQLRWKKLALIFATIASTAFYPSLHGAVVTSGGVTTVAGGGIASGSSADYNFFGGGAQPTSLSDFTLTTSPPNQFNAAAFGVTYASLQPPGGGTVFSTGIAQPSTGAANAPFTVSLATYTLNSNEGTNRAFSVYVLFGNTDGVHVFDQSISLSVDGSTAFTVPLADTTQTNDFLRFNVTGLNAGDTLTVSATSSAVDAQGSTSNKPYIGGVDFALGVPEPSTWAALLAGTGFLVCALRRRHKTQATA